MKTTKTGLGYATTFIIWGLLCFILQGTFFVFASDVDPFAQEDHEWRSLNGPWKTFIYGILLDPLDTNHMLVSTSLGVFHSFNHHASWIRHSEGIQLDTIPRHFRYHPEQAGVIFATGSGPHHDNCRIYKSTDNGFTWADLNLNMSLKDIWIPNDYPDRIIAGGISGVYLSTDSGETWWCKDNEHAYMEFSENDAEPGTIYASVDRGDLAISEDGGETWIVKTHSREDSEKSDVSYGGITVVPGTPPVIFTCWHWMSSESTGQILVTYDEGDTWTVKVNEPINCIEHAPSDPSVIWAGGGTTPWETYDPSIIYKSTDGGETWQDISNEELGSVVALQIDLHDPQTVFLGKIKNGLFITTDGGETWHTSIKYLSNSSCFSLNLQRGGDNFICVSDNVVGLYLTNKNGSLWKMIDNLPVKTNISAAFKPDDPDVLIAGSTNVYYSDDMGETWALTNMYGQSPISSIVYHPSDPDYCYVPRTSYSDSRGLWISSNGGQLWSYVYQDASGLVVEPDAFDPLRIFLTAAAGPNAFFLKSTDGGSTWNNIPDILAARTICSDPLHQDVFYINAYSCPIAKTTDGGNTWETGLGQEITGLINKIDISPETGRIFVVGASGFWYSDDGGYTWTQQNRGLIDINLTTFDFRIENEKETFYVGTSKAGLWKWMQKDEEDPFVDLQSPDGGEIFSAGLVANIVWSESDNEGVLTRDIFLSTDSGNTWPIVIAGALDEGPPYSWTVTNVNSSHCRLKIVVYDAAWHEATDISTADFSIIGNPWTPTPIPTSTPSPFPTSTPSPLTIELNMPSHHFTGGSTCYLKAVVTNRMDTLTDAPIFILLEVFGDIWMAPSWEPYPENFDHYTYSLSPGSTEIIVIPEFTWPNNTGSADNLHFWGFITSPDYSQLKSNFAEWTFGYSS